MTEAQEPRRGDPWARAQIRRLEARIIELEELLRPGARLPPAPITVVTRAVAEAYDTTLEQLTSRTQQAAVVEPRHVAMCLARRLTPCSHPMIARLFGRDPSTVLVAVRAVERREATDPAFALRVVEIERRCRAALRAAVNRPSTPADGESQCRSA